MMNKRVLTHIIIPLLVLILVGVVFNICGFTYVEQYIIASGPILAAFVALYISSNVTHKELYKEELRKKALLKHIRVLLKEAVSSIKKEANNYTEFVENLQNLGMRQTYLKTTPFHYVNELASTDKQTLFNAILSIRSHMEENLIKCYQDIVNSVENARFLKINSRDQYVNFIESYNQQAANWKSVQFEINRLYGDIETNPTENSAFDQGFRDVIEAYNTGLHQGSIDIFNIQNIFENLHQPLSNVLNTYFFQHPYISRLQQILKEMKVSLEKIGEIQGIAITHYSELSTDLIKVSDKLEAQIPFFEI